jgi:shikimate kinase
MKTKRIYLTGFMCAGKSTLGPIIANTLGWGFFDLDRAIEKYTNKTVVEIFRDEGENYFREIETRILTELSEYEKVIISLGGGTLSSSNNLDFIKQKGKLIYLKTSPDKIFLRLKHKTDRPLFHTHEGKPISESEMRMKIQELLQLRESFYNKSDVIFLLEDAKVGKTVDELVKIIKRKF